MAQARLGVEGAKTLLVQDVLLMVGKEQDEGADGTVGLCFSPMNFRSSLTRRILRLNQRIVPMRR